MTFIAAQISDLHVAGDAGTDADPLAATQRALDHLTGMDPRPNVLLVTGDIADDASGYLLVRDRLDAAAIPYFVIPGNHDDRAQLVATFGPPTTSDGFVQYAVDDYPVRIVALDTLVDGEVEGSLCPERLTWLDRTLAQALSTPTLVAMHHPPVETGLWLLDGSGLRGAGRLGEILRANPQVCVVICGHVHRHVTVGWAGTVVHVAPPISWHAAADLGDEQPPSMTSEPSGILLHVAVGGGVATHRVQVGTFESTAFDVGDWDAVKAHVKRVRALHPRERLPALRDERG